MATPTHDSPGAPAGGLDRRRFLTFLVAAPTLVVGGRFATPAEAATDSAGAVVGPPQPADVFDLGDVLILAGTPTADMITLVARPNGTFAFALHRAEVGQGLTTAVGMLIADELDVRLSKVIVTLADSRPELLFNQLTGSSNSIRALYGPVRKMAAAARARMLETAARTWGVDAASLSVRDGAISSPAGHRGTYGDFATAAAAGVDAPTGSPPTKASADLTLVGRPTTRTDALDAITGRKKFTLDIDVPGAKPVMVRRPPTLNGTVVRVNNLPAVRAMPGVLGIAVIATGVAVMAETFGQSLTALNALNVTWGPGTVDNESSASIAAKLKAASPALPAPPLLAQTVDAEFEWAFVNHAPLETNAAIADVRPGRAEIWSAFKTPIIAQQAIARMLGLPQDKVVVHVVTAGGSFGRHLFYDAALEAAQVSKALGRPVKLKWTRTDDMRYGRAHPASHHRLRATIALGQVVAFEQRVTSVETDFRHGLGEIFSATSTELPIAGNNSIAQSLFLTTIKSPYNVGVVSQLLNELPLRMPTASWRSVYSYSTRGSEEILLDEIAARLGKDPVAFRRSLLKTDRQRAVLNKVAAAGRWGRAMPAGRAQGVGFHDEYESCTACLVEIDARNPRKPRVTKAVIAVDVGRAINPRGLEAQMLGGLTDAISVTLQAGIHVLKGLPLEGSYSEFHYARQKDSPTDVQVFVMPPNGEPGGAGELGVPAAVGAIANAYARATGTKPRSFPINFPVDFTPRPPSLSPQPPYLA